jgi:alpha-L-fucosidase
MLRHNPYAEWYLNSMRLKRSPTAVHHAATYGADYPYDNFAKTFDDASAGADFDQMADACRDAGARYVVLTTKHHDGFALWPSAVAHPVKGAYHARRDLVGGLTEAVRARRMRMGLYYSGGYDWPYNDAVIARAADAVLAAPQGPRYVAYVTAHVRELIERYAPSVLWNDISWPGGGNLAELFARYYNAVPDGVVNDRWTEPAFSRNWFSEGLVRAAGGLLQVLWPLIPAKRKRLTFDAPRHCDFRTPEYQVLHTVSDRKWEMVRGVGHSFGANRHEALEDIIGPDELIQMFCDVVAKNGNLLIGVGPRPDGSIPEEQLVPLRALGQWLEVNGDAIYGSRPWILAESRTREGQAVRFTRSGDGVYALVLGISAAAPRRLTLPAVDARAIRRVRLVGHHDELDWTAEDGGLAVTLPDRLPDSPVSVFDLGAGVRARLVPGRRHEH